MSNRMLTRVSSVALGLVLAAGCTDLEVPTGTLQPAEQALANQSSNKNKNKNKQVTTATTASAAVGEVCETIDFNLPAFAHGDQVTQVSVPTLGLTLGVSVAPNVVGGGNDAGPYVFSTDLDPNGWEDDDLLWRQTALEDGICLDCEGLGQLLVIGDERGFTSGVPGVDNEGDSRFGGSITFSGFPASGGFSIRSFTAVDIDVLGPESLALLVDGSTVAQVAGGPDGNVQQISTTPHTINNGSVTFAFAASGGIDNLKVCGQPETLGAEGCTLGYWKNHLFAWSATGYSTTQDLESVFDLPDGLGLDGVSLRDALAFGGGPGAVGGAKILLKQAVAAILSASHPDVDYGITSASILAAVNQALASGDRQTMISLSEQLDRLNNAGCPLGN